MLALMSAPALADSIDGDWCHSDGRRFTISGPQIVTPKGHQVTGDYSRHAYSYTVPASEPSAGQAIDMTLINENMVHLTIGKPAGGAPEVWERCKPSVSDRGDKRWRLG
jgi:hypothetical protein